MQVTWLCLLGLIYCTGIVTSSNSKNNVFTSSFLVRFKRNINNDLAHIIANRNGFENIGTDLIQYFENQTAFNLIDGAKLVRTYMNSNLDLSKQEQHEIIKLAVDHLMKCKSNNPSTEDNKLWAQCLADIFPKLRDAEGTSDINYSLIYNPEKNDGFFGTRIKTVQRNALRLKKAINNRLNLTEFPEENQITTCEFDYDELYNNSLNQIEYMKAANSSNDFEEILRLHRMTFKIRTLLLDNQITGNNSKSILIDFPKFLEIDCLTEIDFSTRYPGKPNLFRAKFDEVLQKRIIALSAKDKKYIKLADSFKENQGAVSLGKGKSNRCKIEDCFDRIIYFHKLPGGEGKEFHFKHRTLPHARSRRSITHTRVLKKEPLIHSAVQQPGFVRVKRGYNSRTLPIPVTTAPSNNDLFSTDRSIGLIGIPPSDPYFPLQWYLRNTGQNGGKMRLDLNVQAAWDQGITGKNVTTAIMDDGVDYMHPDLKYNYNAEASYDFSSNDPFPYPRYTDDWFNSHGTRCAGEVAAARDNGICGVGVAYDSKIAGIRMLDQPYMTDLIEANSMGHEPHKIHIYSASWGPTDDGKTVDGPRNATMRAIVQGVNEGRNGLGNIYVWASGDGGEEDDCNCDGYAASMWTISINSAINDGQNAHYDESCSSTLASTFSNGAKDPNTGVATTDLYGKCTTTHSGTSAAAPEAAGVFALALEANPTLTWRDVQHLTVLTSKRNSLFDAKNRFHWTMNGVGLEFNHLFGFGVLDAGAMVTLAKNWITVPPRYHCEAGQIIEPYAIPSGRSVFLEIKTDACKNTDTEVNYLEHVQAVITANSSRRGDLELFLTSPMGTRSMILSRRANDDDHRDGFTKWPFMTTHTWSEYPHGTWILEVKFNSQQPRTGWLKEWSLVLHGTKDPPYRSLAPASPHSKLAIVKKAHEERKM